MFNEKQITHISKFLSLVLRHKPETIGIKLDANGWADVEELLKKANANGIMFDLELLKWVVETNAKKRFAFNDSFDKIRASQGHSIDVDLGYNPQEPPEILFHGTGEHFVLSIFESGLEKRARQHVHLSSDVDTAIRVGQRHGRPFVLKVRSGQMYRDRYKFFLSENGVWLTDHVPVKYLERNGV